MYLYRLLFDPQRLSLLWSPQKYDHHIKACVFFDVNSFVNNQLQSPNTQSSPWVPSLLTPTTSLIAPTNNNIPHSTIQHQPQPKSYSLSIDTSTTSPNYSMPKISTPTTTTPTQYPYETTLSTHAPTEIPHITHHPMQTCLQIGNWHPKKIHDFSHKLTLHHTHMLLSNHQTTSIEICHFTRIPCLTTRLDIGSPTTQSKHSRMFMDL